MKCGILTRTLFLAVAFSCLGAPAESSATTLFQVDHYYTDRNGNIGLHTRGGAQRDLQFRGNIEQTTPGGPLIGSWLNGTVGEDTAILSFFFSFDTEVFRDTNLDGTFDTLIDSGRITLQGGNITVTARDGAFDGVYTDPVTGQQFNGWENEQWFSTQRSFGGWESDISLLVDNGFGGPLHLVGTPRGPLGFSCLEGETLCHTGISLFSWLGLQYTRQADIALDVSGFNVSFQGMPPADIPEPMTMSLLGSGLLGAFVKRKKKEK